MAENTTRPNRRKIRVGVVVSDKMEKTIVVRVQRRKAHAKYGKILRHSSKYYAHDEKKEAHVGDTVEITETRPLSKLKRWRLQRVIVKAK